MIRTGGGAFDPTQRHRYFLAGDGWMEEGSWLHADVLLAANTLASPQKLAMLDRMLDAGVNVLLDSGIFTLASDHARSTGLTLKQAFAVAPESMPGFTDLWALYVKLVRRYEARLWGYVELDLGGTEGKRRLRARLEAMDLQPMPVYHPLGDGPAYFDELAESYDRLCYANLADGDSATRKRLLLTAWEQHRRYPELWVHALGATPSEWLAGFPSDSTDSSSWLGGVRWGGEAATAYMRRVDALPVSYRYSAPDQAPAAVALAAANAHFLGRTWQRLRADLDRDLQCCAYPAPEAVA